MKVPDSSYDACAMRKSMSAGIRRPRGIKESFKLTRKMLLSFLAAIPAALMPLSATCQMAKEKAPALTTEPQYKYEVFVGWGYTSLNQVNQSNSGLQGVSLSLTRDWGKYFGITAEGGHYAWTVTASNPVSSSVDLYLAGPAFHAPLYERASLFIHGLLGAAHTGGVSIKPNESFAGGVGLGVDYKLGPHLGLRAYGDDIGSSFTLTPYQPGDSPHRRFNARGSIGVTYKF
jgi:hypothetical protein